MITMSQTKSANYLFIVVVLKSMRNSGVITAAEYERAKRYYSGSAWRCRSELLPKPARHRDEESSCRRKADDALHPRQP